MFAIFANPEVVTTSRTLACRYNYNKIFIDSRGNREGGSKNLKDLFQLCHTLGVTCYFFLYKNSGLYFLRDIANIRLPDKKNSTFRYKRPKRAVRALRVWPHVLKHIFLYKCMRTPSWLTVYRHQKCAATQLHLTAVDTTILHSNRLRR